MPEESMNQEFRLKEIDEVRNYLIEKTNQNELMSKKNKKFCGVLNYIDHPLIVISTIIGCVSISAFASLVGIPIGIASSTIGLKTCLTTAGIKMYKSIIKKKRKKHDKIVLLAKSKLNSIAALISNASINSNTSHNEFVLVNNVLKEFSDIKEKLKILTINKSLNYI